MGFRSLMKTVGGALVAVVLSGAALAADPGARPTAYEGAQAASLQIILQLDSADVQVSSAGSWVPLYLQNISQQVGGLEVSLLLDRPDLFKFSSNSVVETTIVCIDPIDCNPADTTIDTVANSPVDTAGCAISGWEFVEARALSSINLKLVAVANQPGGVTVPPLPTGGPRLLCKVYLEKVAASSLLDTLHDRKTRVLIDASSTSFSTATGTTIGRLDSIVCLNPPSCTQKDTVHYTDPTAFIFVDGVRQFGPACVKGDVNLSGNINSADIIYLVNFVFKAGAVPKCSPTTGDVNCNGVTNSADIIYLVNFVFKGGTPPGSC
jgi:hypothetical protein